MLSVEQRQMFSERLDAHEANAPGYRAMWAQLEERLLALGGCGVVVTPWLDAELVALVDDGRVCHAVRTDLVLGQPSRCHHNAADAWIHGGCELWTGYGLTAADGLWRQHSWTQRAGVIEESTVERDLYWGVHVDNPLHAVQWAVSCHEDIDHALDHVSASRRDELLALMRAVLELGADSFRDGTLRP